MDKEEPYARHTLPPLISRRTHKLNTADYLHTWTSKFLTAMSINMFILKAPAAKNIYL